MTTHNRYFRFLLIASIALLCVVSLAAAAGTRIETALSGGGKAVLTFADHPLKSMTEEAFGIELFDDQGEVIADAALKLSLTMPAMPMPPNQPAVGWADGAYRGKAIFTMAGRWQINVDIERPATSPETISFDIAMVLMK